jgi:hypothetical protein
MKKILFLLLAMTTLCPQISWAGQRAEVMVLPTRIVMENKDRYTTVIIKNTGDATGNFSVDMIDMTMQEDGMVVPLEKGGGDPYSAIPYLRIAPKSMVLKPGEAQNVRIMLRKPEGLQPGEYRSHIRVKIENDNVEPSRSPGKEATQAPKAPKESQITVKTNLVLIIPVIVRNGETSLSLWMASPKIIRSAKGVPALKVTLLRQGNRSSMGDFNVTYNAPGGKPQIIKRFPGIPVYRSVNQRTVLIPMDDIPKGINLSTGKLDITYSAQEKEGGKKLAQAQLDLAVH